MSTSVVRFAASLFVLFSLLATPSVGQSSTYRLSKVELASAAEEAAREDAVALKLGERLFLHEFRNRGWCIEEAFWAAQSAIEFDRQLAVLNQLYCTVLAVRFNQSPTAFYKPAQESKALLCAPSAVEAELNKIDAAVAVLGPQTEATLRRPVKVGEFEFAMAKRRPKILAHRDFICKQP